MQRNEFYPVSVEGRVVDGDGQPKFGFHDLRHFFASWLIETLKYHPKRVQILMGHSSIKTTYDIYGHLFADTDQLDDFAAGSAAVMGI